MRFTMPTLIGVALTSMLITKPAAAQSTTDTDCYNFGQSISCTSRTKPDRPRSNSAVNGAVAGFLLGKAINDMIEEDEREKEEKQQKEAMLVTRLVRASLEELAVREMVTWDEANTIWSGFYDAYTAAGMMLVVREVVGDDRAEWVTYHLKQIIRARLEGVDLDTDQVRNFATELTK